MRPERLTGTQGRLLAAQLLESGVAVRIRVHGTSMWPSLLNGTQVELEPLETAPRPGDIVFTDVAGEGQRLHRVMRARSGGRVQTRGDACLRLDPPVARKAVLGRVRRVRSLAGAWRPCAPRLLSGPLARLLLGLSSGMALVLRLVAEAPRIR